MFILHPTVLAGAFVFWFLAELIFRSQGHTTNDAMKIATWWFTGAAVVGAAGNPGVIPPDVADRVFWVSLFEVFALYGTLATVFYYARVWTSKFVRQVKVRQDSR